MKFNQLVIQLFYRVPFYNTCLNLFNISSLFSGGITISSTSFKFSPGTCFDFTILLVIMFPMNSPVASVALWTMFLEAVFKASSPVFVAVSIVFCVC